MNINIRKMPFFHKRNNDLKDLAGHTRPLNVKKFFLDIFFVLDKNSLKSSEDWKHYETLTYFLMDIVYPYLYVKRINDL